MLAESVHSVADTINQLLLIVGQRPAREPPDMLHQFGYGRSRYFYSFVVALMTFAMGSVKAPPGSRTRRSGRPCRPLNPLTVLSTCELEYLGPHEVLVVAKVMFGPELELAAAARAVAIAEKQVRSAIPAVRMIYLQPEVENV
jgi:hypothetical protein